MSRHHRTAGVDYTLLTIGENTYKLRPITLGDYAEIESHILSTCADQSMRHITNEQLSIFENSHAGHAWFLWKCLQADHREFDSIAKVLRLIESAGEDEYPRIVETVRIASGSADTEKMIWPHLEHQQPSDTDPGPGWPDIYCFFAANYGWTPQQVNQLTFFQFAIYSGAITPEHRRIKVKPEAARSILKQCDNHSK